MDSFNEKKWHVFFAGKQEGPFSLDELRPRFAPGGGLDSATYAWCNGMADWESVTRIADFGEILNPPPGDQRTSAIQLPMESKAGPTQPMSLEPTRSGVVVKAEPVVSPSAGAAGVPLAATAQPPGPAKKEKKASVSAGFVVSLLLIGLAAGGGYAAYSGKLDPVLENPAVKAALVSARDLAQPIIFKAVEKVPALGRFISPLPNLPGVSSDELLDLKEAVLGSPQADGPRVALALDGTDPLASSFHIVSNLPDGAAFEVRVDGAPDRILNQLSFSSVLKATLEKRIGRTGVLRQPDGRPLPRGEYIVHVFEADQQSEAVAQVLSGFPAASMKVGASMPQGRKLILKKVFFLGGAQDATFTESLKVFHESIIAKASNERQDTGQYMATLESQLTSTNVLFDKLSKGKIGKSQQKQWESFHANWSQMDAQLQETFQKWTPEVLQNEYFYGVAYQAIQQAGQAVSKVHGIHHGYFTGSVDKSAFPIQRGEAQSQANFALSALKAKLEQMDRLPKSAAGIPSREGL